MQNKMKNKQRRFTYARVPLTVAQQKQSHHKHNKQGEARIPNVIPKKYIYNTLIDRQVRGLGGGEEEGGRRGGKRKARKLIDETHLASACEALQHGNTWRAGQHLGTCPPQTGV